MSDYEAHIEVEPNVHLIRGENKSRFPEANSLLIDDEILTLVDAGSSLANIKTTLRDLGYTLTDIDRTILSHFHIDHKGHAEEIRKISQCEIMCNHLSEKGIRSFDGMVEYYGVASSEYYSDWKALLENWVKHIVADYHVDSNFKDGIPIECGDIELIPIHLPGHTIDHTGFGINGMDTLFLVDIDLTRFGPWYGNAVSDIWYFKRSIEVAMELNPDCIISSHLLNPVKENIQNRLQTYLNVFDERENRILQNIKDGYDTVKKLAQLPTIYPKIPFNVYLIFEEFMLEKHLEQLQQNGVVNEEHGKYKVTE